MPLVSHSFTWEQDGRLHSRLQTNVGPERLRRRLAAIGHGETADDIIKHPDLLRLNGGSYLLVRWAAGVTREQLQGVLARL